MIFNLILLFLLCIHILCGGEFRIITLEGCAKKMGMFSAADQVLAQLYLFEEGGDISRLTVDFGIRGLYYDPRYGPNWWDYYFESIDVGERDAVSIIDLDKKDYMYAWQQRRQMSRQTAASIVKKYIFIKPHIQQKIDAFVDRFFRGHYVIGVHYRGTDKIKEAPVVPFQRVFWEIEQHLPQDKPYVLFIATDEESFLREAREKYTDKVVAIKAVRSKKGSLGVHIVNAHNYCLGEQALMDTSLLSKCDLLIRTSSNLSRWSTYFNPDLPVILLNQQNIPTLEPE